MIVEKDNLSDYLLNGCYKRRTLEAKRDFTIGVETLTHWLYMNNKMDSETAEVIETFVCIMLESTEVE